jgi:hypothetical protein
MAAVFDRFRMGEWNVCRQEVLPSGDTRITMTKRGDPHTYVVVVRNLYGAMQVIVSEEVLDV